MSLRHLNIFLKGGMVLYLIMAILYMRIYIYKYIKLRNTFLYLYAFFINVNTQSKYWNNLNPFILWYIKYGCTKCTMFCFPLRNVSSYLLIYFYEMLIIDFFSNKHTILKIWVYCFLYLIKCVMGWVSF